MSTSTTSPVQTPTNILTDRRVVITLYIAAVFLFWMAQYLYVPTLPTYAQTKTDNLAAVGFILSMYGLWQALIRIPLGLAADWLGWRKPFILSGLALAGVGAGQSGCKARGVSAIMRATGRRGESDQTTLT
jgi:MFS family permease